MRVTPALIRWGGLAGSAATAGAAWLGGAGFERLPSVNPGTLLSGQRGVLLPVLWVAGTAALILAWWFGRHVVPSVRWAVVTVGLWFLPVLAFLPLGSADVYSYACQGWVQHAGGDPYGGGVGGSGCPWLGSVDRTWASSPAPYGPFYLLLSGWAAAAAGSSLPAVIVGLRVIALLGLALLAAGLPVLARRAGGLPGLAGDAGGLAGRAGADPAKAVWVVLACPIVAIHMVSGAHNDAVMMGLIVAGLAVVVRWPRLLWAGGAALGLAVAVKATAVVVIPFAVLLVSRDWRRLWRPAVPILGGALGALGVVSLLSGRGVGWIGGLLRSGDTVAWTSPPTAVGLTIELATGYDAVPVTRALGVALLAVVLVVLFFRCLRRGDPLGHAGLALAATVVCAPVFHPWYALWPLAVLAAVRAESRWLLGLCAFAATLTLPAGYNWALFTRVPGAVLMTCAVVVLVVVATRRRAARRVVA